ncbi:LamG-like jellyroll fold domain-containing protein [Frigidibacter sp. MR17.14]|uniref:LamG-like jellyroll fold domain-containing protein n=1 Tax=Frigidibacter sp. MR17.14 TaxID=3126509 RepID=UPI003012E0E8
MTTITVHNTAELKDAMYLLSKTGGTIAVASNDLGYTLNISNVGNSETPITIVAADPSDPPDFNYVKMTSTTNITFDGVMFDSSDAATDAAKDVELYSTTGVTFQNCTFIGASDGYFAGTGTATIGGNMAYVRGCTDTAFLNNTISNYGHGIAVINSNGTTIAGNDISQLTFDGIRLTGAVDTLIENNYIHDFYGSDQNYNHSDMIQVFAAGGLTTQNTENLVIRSNLMTTDGVATQSIFIANETINNADGQPYENIVIEDNTIYNGQTHGIYISNADDVVVSDNTLLWNTSAVMKSTTSSPTTSAPSIKLLSVTNGTVTNNIAAGYSTGTATASDNISYSLDPTSANYAGDNFVNVISAGNIDQRDLTLLADSAWLGHGSSLSQPGSEEIADTSGAIISETTGKAALVEAEDVTAVIRQDSSIREPGLVIYDASLSNVDGVVLDPATTRYIWTFDDGTSLEGVSVSHTYADAGIHDVVLTVITGSGASDTIERTTKTSPDLLIDIDFEGGISDDSGFSTTVWSSGSNTEVAGQNGTGFHLDGSSKLYIKGSQIYDRQNFTFALTATLDSKTDSGVLVHMHKAFQIQVTSKGALNVTFWTTGGTVSVTSAAGIMSDGAAHRIAFAFAGGQGGELVLYVDGKEVGTADVSSGLPDTGTYNLVIGNTFNSSVHAVVDDITMLGTARGDDWAASDYAEAFGLETVQDDAAIVAPVAAAPVIVDTPDLLPDGLLAGLALATRLSDPNDGTSGGDLLRLTFENGIKDDSGTTTKLGSSGAARSLVDTGLTGTGFHLDGSSKVIIGRGNTYLQKQEDFTVALSMKLDSDRSAGVFMHLHKGMTAKINKDGSISINIELANGTGVTVTSAAGTMSDGDWHRIVFAMDGGKGGALTLYVDGEAVATAATDQVMNTSMIGKYDWVIGNTWNSSVTATVDDVEFTSKAMTASDAAADFAHQQKLIAALAHPDLVGVGVVGDSHIGTVENDVITGTAAAELLFGREGNDTLTGGAGADCFVFDRAFTAHNIDTITDFASAEGDRILIDADLLGLEAGTTAKAQFAAGTEAPSADIHFVYDADSGQLWFDADGSGEQDKQLILRLAPGTALSGHDITMF